MDHLPAAIARVLEPFAPVFRRPTWRRARQLLVGAILTPGARTVAAALRTLGLEHSQGFSSYHRVLRPAHRHGYLVPQRPAAGCDPLGAAA
jgi:hypothetical protein